MPNQRNQRNQQNRGRQTETPGDPTSCRAVSILLTRNKGVPVSAALSPGNATRIAAEEALFGFAITGARTSGQMFARIGIYNFEGGIPVFKFAVNFNMTDGSPIYRPEQASRQSVSESEMALVNWAQGALFNMELTAGEYYMRLDRVNSAEPAEPSEVREEVAKLPKRRDFAAERRLEAAFENFDNFLEKLEGSELKGMPHKPTVVPMIIQDQIAPHVIKDGVPTVPMGTTEISLAEFKSFAMGRFSEGLRVPTGNHREIKATFIRSFETIDKMRDVGARPAMIAATLDRTIESVRASAYKHIESLDPKRVRMDDQKNSIEMALASLRAYVDWRNADGTAICMFTPPRVDAHGEVEGYEKAQVKQALSYFERPMFNVVQGVPIQIVTDYQTTGDLPYNGLELFR